MGYCPDLTVIDVKFDMTYEKDVREKLKAYNKDKLIPKNDWCRFHPALEDIVEIFDEIGFELVEKCGFYQITEFLGEKLGSHEGIIRLLANYLTDCEVKFVGEDDTAWKFKVVNGVAQPSIYREEF